MFKSIGKLNYDPKARIKFEPWWCILKTDKGLMRYYQHWIKQQYDLQFKNTVWGSHISVVRGTKPANEAVWKKYEGKEIDFKYSSEIYRVHWFFCIDVVSKDLEDIREEMGLSRLPKSGFHLTIGRIDKQYLQRKKELWETYVKEKLGIPVTDIDKKLQTLIEI